MIHKHMCRADRWESWRNVSITSSICDSKVSFHYSCHSCFYSPITIVSSASSSSTPASLKSLPSSIPSSSSSISSSKRLPFSSSSSSSSFKSLSSILSSKPLPPSSPSSSSSHVWIFVWEARTDENCSNEFSIITQPSEQLGDDDGVVLNCCKDWGLQMSVSQQEEALSRSLRSNFEPSGRNVSVNNRGYKYLWIIRSH